MKDRPIDSIVHDIAALAIEARPLKTSLRARWERPMADEQRRLAVLRARITELLVTLAHGRGRMHRRRAPAGAPADWDAATDAAAVATRVLARYARQTPVPPAEHVA